MTGPTYRRAVRFFFEPAPRPPMAHPAAFVDQAHRAPKPEPLWRAVLVLLLSIPAIALIVTIVLAPVPS